jgi:hypothetical protein
MKYYNLLLPFCLAFLLSGCYKTNDVINAKTAINLYATPRDEELVQLIESKDGGFIILGSYKQSPTSNNEFLLIKADKNGKQIWRNTYSNALSVFPVRVVENPDGKILAAGNIILADHTDRPYFVQMDNMGNFTGSFVYPLQFAGELSDLQPTASGFIASFYYDTYSAFYASGSLLARINFNGNTLWKKEYPTYYDGYRFSRITSTFQGADGAYISTGFWSGNCLITNDPSQAVFSFNDLMLIKTDEKGGNICAKDYSAGADQIGAFVKQCPDQGLILVANSHLKNASNSSVAIQKTDNNGDSLWSKYLVDDFYTPCGLSDVNSDGFALLVLSYNKTLSLIKFDLNGNKVWQKSYFPDKNFTSASLISRSGSYAIAGTTLSFGSGKNNKDIVLFKVDENGELEK